MKILNSILSRISIFSTPFLVALVLVVLTIIFAIAAFSSGQREIEPTAVAATIQIIPTKPPATETATATLTPSRTATATITNTATATPTATETATPTASATPSATITNTATATPTATETATVTSTATATNTPTNTPTATSTATMTATPTPSIPVAIAITTLDIRVGPGIAYPIIRRIAIGQELTLLGKLPDESWYQVSIVDTNYTEAWVNAEHINTIGPDVPDVEPPTPTPAPTFTTVPSPTPTATFTALPTITSAPTRTIESCQSNLQARLSGGTNARTVPGVRLELGDTAGDSTGYAIDGGTLVEIVSGARCVNNILWYEVYFRTGEKEREEETYWLPESDNSRYVLEPLVMPDSSEFTVNSQTTHLENVCTAYQAFERGHMFWIKSLEQIWVLYNDETWDIFVVREFDEVTIDESPPSDFSVPMSGFAIVWETTGVRERLGWGLMGEAAVVNEIEYLPSQGRIILSYHRANLYHLTVDEQNWFIEGTETLPEQDWQRFCSDDEQEE